MVLKSLTLQTGGSACSLNLATSNNYSLLIGVILVLSLLGS